MEYIWPSERAICYTYSPLRGLYARFEPSGVDKHDFERAPQQAHFDLYILVSVISQKKNIYMYI